MAKRLIALYIVSLLLLILCTYAIYTLLPYPAPLMFFGLALIVISLMRCTFKRLIGKDRLGPRLLLVAPFIVCWLPIEISDFLTRRVTEKYPTLWRTELRLTQTELINATETLGMALKFNPLNHGAALLVANCYLEMEDYTMASKWTNRVLFLYPFSEDAQLIVSNIAQTKLRHRPVQKPRSAQDE